MKKNAQQKVKHKPNARHTLNEVLHSLQDLMHNELAGIGDNEARSPSAETTVPRSKEEVLKSLKALIGNSINSAAASNAAADEPSLQAIIDQIPDEGAPDDFTADEDHAIAMDDPAGDNETMLTGLEINAEPVPTGIPENQDAESTPPSADEFRLEMEEPHEPEPGAGNKPAAKKTARQSRHKTVEPAKPGTGEQVEISWDDIPVLNEVVAPPPAPGGTTMQEAREIAVKVAAILNIEARKNGGKSTMDIKTIMRLQSLLSQELQDRQDVDSGEDARGTSGDDDT